MTAARDAARPVLIPTPREMTVLPGRPRGFAIGSPGRVFLPAAQDERTAFAAEFLRRELAKATGGTWRTRTYGADGPTGVRPQDIVLWDRRAVDIQPSLPARLRRLEGLAAEQGYALRASAGTPVVVYAASSLGLLYGAATLVQLLEREGAGMTLANVAVWDAPAVRVRGTNWNLMGEVGGWSYDRADGRRAYERRIVRKLDLCVRYKINLVNFDGFGWNADRFAGYAATMRRLNRAARLRGIRLMYGGYGSSYGAGALHDGTVFRNRRSYPDGAVYACCGHPGSRWTEHSRTMGTCLSNPALLKLQQRELARFVRRVEPGALYIHNIDSATISACRQLWALRCPGCRRRWPNDDVAAPDGMAGAFAMFYDALADAINEVRSADGTYDARRDCALVMVSPGYTIQDESDADWRRACRYFALLSSLLRNDNILFGLREQFRNRASGGSRYRQMRRRIAAEGRGHGLAGLYFLGADGYFNNYPFLGTPALGHCFDGTEMAMHCSGTAYQEPQQLLNAEYAWNPQGSTFGAVSLPASYEGFTRTYNALRRGRRRPRKIFGPGGFLDVACEKLYGRRAGRIVAEIYRMQGKRSIASFVRAGGRTTPLLPAWNVLLPDAVLQTAGILWQPVLKRGTQRRIDALRDVYAETRGLNARAERLAAKAARMCRDEPETAGDLLWLRQTLHAGRRLMELTSDYLRMFARAHRAAVAGRRPGSKLLADITNLRRRLGAFRRSVRATAGEPVDHLGGDIRRRREIADRLRDDLAAMAKTLRTGTWPAPTRVQWW